jgi:dATP pyrophosphohydrolase
MTRAPFQVLVVPYRRGERGLQVAVLRRADHDVWQFVSGGGEAGETVEMAARREGREEAGIAEDAPYTRLDAMAMLPACWFSAWSSWPSGLLVVPEHALAVDVGELAIALSDEHVAVRWVGYDEAIALLRFDSNKIALWELHERLYPAARIKRAAFDARHDRCACSRGAV